MYYLEKELEEAYRTFLEDYTEHQQKPSADDFLALEPDTFAVIESLDDYETFLERKLATTRRRKIKMAMVRLQGAWRKRRAGSSND